MKKAILTSFLLAFTSFSFSQFDFDQTPWERAYDNCADSIKKANGSLGLSNVNEGTCLLASYRAADEFLKEAYEYQEGVLVESLVNDKNGLDRDIQIQYESLITMKNSFFAYRDAYAELEGASWTNGSGRGNHEISVLLELTVKEIKRLKDLPLLTQK